MSWSWIGRCLVAAIGAVCAVAAQAGEPALPPLLKTQLQGILAASNTAAATVMLVDGLGASGTLQHGKNGCLPACEGPRPNALMAPLAMRLTRRQCKTGGCRRTVRFGSGAIQCGRTQLAG